MDVTFVKLLWTFSMAGLASVESYGGVGVSSGSVSSSSSASFSGNTGGAGGGLLGGLFGGEGKFRLGNLQFSASLGGNDGGILGGGLLGSGGSFGFGALGGGSIDASKDLYGESIVSFGGFGQDSSNERVKGPSGGYGYGASTTGDSGGTYGEFISSGRSGQSGPQKGGYAASGEYGNGGKGNAASFAGASPGVSTFSQITDGFDNVEYGNSDARSLPKGNSENNIRKYGEHSTVITSEFGGPHNCGSKIGCLGSEVYANDKIAVSSNGGGSLTERDSGFLISGKAEGPAVFSSGVSLGSHSPGSASVEIGGSVSGGGYGKQLIQSGLPNVQDGSFLGPSVSTDGTILVSGGNKEKSIEKNVGGNNGGNSYSSTIHGSGVGGLQFGADIAAEIAKGPKPQIENVFLQNSEKDTLVTSEFEGGGPGVYVTESKSCSGSSCSHHRVNGDEKAKSIAPAGGGGYGKQRIQNGGRNGQDGSFLESGISIDGTVSVSGGNKEKAIERHDGFNNDGSDSYSSILSGSGVGGLQFGAEIAAEIEKGPKPQIENVFLQNSEKGILVTSEFEGRGRGGYESESKSHNHDASGFDGKGSINTDRNIGFDFTFESSGNVGGSSFDTVGGGGAYETGGRGYSADISGSQADIFDGSSKSCGGYGCGGQGGSEKTSIGISAGGASSFASGSFGTGSYGYGR